MTDPKQIELKDQADQFRDTKRDDKRRFLLSEAEWYSVQTYCAAVKKLPISDNEIKLKLELLPDDDVAKFSDMRDQYKAMYEHVHGWDAVVTKSVGLATGINNYGRNAKTYYGELLDLATQGLSDPQRKKEFLEIVDNRAAEAKKYAAEATAVTEGVRKFHQQTSEDAVRMGKLKEKYDKEYDHENEAWKKVDKEIKDMENELTALRDDYNHACVVAGTTPTYAWCTVFGFIAAVTVAGIYGKKAAELKSRIDEIENKLGVLKGQLNRNAHIRMSVKVAQGSVTETKGLTDRALHTLGKMRGGWESIERNLKDIAKLVDEDIRKAESLVKLQVKQAINDWENVAGQAQDYAQNAYIKVQTTTPELAYA
ncbi:alpha-xenorhabdolysin family binary toxin subunit A [Nocardiopsis sp. NPDC050513]|uniref:alpha-xenorhabdolysin family binary toxin subunit A n=1 Tax=Nocardiopsis sp. NPDC050513 TaxID=3364338 RepID=UPI003795FF42